MKYFIGIDLGWKDKKTTGICILGQERSTLHPKSDWCSNCGDFWGWEIIEKIKPYLVHTKVIAIDAPLTGGRGKGDMRLYEKFLSTRIFRKEKVAPPPPALMPKLCVLAREIVSLMGSLGFKLNDSLIEVCPTLTQKMTGENLVSILGKGSKDNIPCRSENQKSALICALLAYLHFLGKTRYLGHKDGFLFLPQMSFWQQDWRENFFQAWNERSRLKYRYLKTNIFK